MNRVEQAHEFSRQHGHFGWRADREDWSRCRAVRLAAMPVSTEIDIEALPQSMGVGRWMQIENQGSIGSCAGHARTSCQELAFYRQSRGRTIQLNRMFAYLSAQRRDGIIGDNGSTISGNCDAAHEWGTCLEEIWPYRAVYPLGGWRAIPQRCWDEAPQYRIQSWKPLQNYGEVLAWLVHGVGGVDIGIQWNVDPDREGKVDRYRQSGGGHSVALLDWDKKLLDGKGRPYIDLFNSWGRDWGIEGRCRVSPEVIDQWCRDQTVVGTSDMIDIAPRPFDWLHESFFAK